MTAIRTEAERRRMVAFIEAQPLPLDVACEPWRAPRTNPQNAYLWAAVYAPLVERCGFSADTLTMRRAPSRSCRGLTEIVLPLSRAPQCRCAL